MDESEFLNYISYKINRHSNYSRGVSGSNNFYFGMYLEAPKQFECLLIMILMLIE